MNRKLPLVIKHPVMPTYWQIVCAKSVNEMIDHCRRYVSETVALNAYVRTVQLRKVKGNSNGSQHTNITASRYAQTTDG